MAANSKRSRSGAALSTGEPPMFIDILLSSSGTALRDPDHRTQMHPEPLRFRIARTRSGGDRNGWYRGPWDLEGPSGAWVPESWYIGGYHIVTPPHSRAPNLWVGGWSLGDVQDGGVGRMQIFRCLGTRDQGCGVGPAAVAGLRRQRARYSGVLAPVTKRAGLARPLWPGSVASGPDNQVSWRP